jgi:hypothetical protein
VSEDEKDEEDEETRPMITDRIEQLKKLGKNNAEIVVTLYDEGYSTKEIMEQHLPLKALKAKQEERADSQIMGIIEGTTKGTGYLNELKGMIRSQISRSRELTEFFYNVGIGTLLASLRKSGIGIEDFRKIALEQEGLKKALTAAGETAFKALEYYQSDMVGKVEAERDEARAYASVLETRTGEFVKQLDPRFRLERMIQAYLLSGNVDADTLTTLIDKWLSIEVADVKLELMK